MEKDHGAHFLAASSLENVAQLAIYRAIWQP